ncbi:MAG: TetR/AcrR family transcriptional regulator [Nitratireductor sp.]
MARTIARDHEEKRALIRKRAARVFAETGFDRASMSQLAADCGISKASIYHYYASKQALLFDILDHHLNALAERLSGIDAAKPQERLNAMLREILLAYRGADDEHRLQINAIGQLPVGEQEKLKSCQRKIVAVMRSAIAEAGPAGLANDSRKLHATTMSVFGMLNWFYMWNRDDTVEARLDYASLVGGLLQGGFAAISEDEFSAATPSMLQKR